MTLYRSDWTPHQTRPVVAYTRDIGTGGLYAETDERFEIGDQVDVVLATPSTWEPLILKGEICRFERTEDDVGEGVALRFLEMDDAQAVALAEFMDSLDYEG